MESEKSKFDEESLGNLFDAIQGGQGSSNGDSADDQSSEALMMSIFVIGRTSGVRYVKRLAGAYVRFSSMRSANEHHLRNASKPEASRVSIDECLALIREVGDIANEEAAMLRAEFDKLGECIVRSTLQAERTRARRYWRAKE
mgnify:CR=1 FL=1